jgi:amino acid adenylation domain-containing protein
MVTEARAALVVSRARQAAWPDGCDVETLMDVPPADGFAPDHRGADAPAYVIFTSGSTGSPKGVLVGRRSVAWLVEALEEAGLYQCGPRVVAWNASISFDASVQQWVRVCRGDTLVLLDEELRTEADRLAAHLRRHAVTDIDATPSHWELLHERLVAGTSGGTPLRLLLGGEAITPQLWRRLGDAARRGALEAFNVYGPAECTVDATMAVVRGDHPSIGTTLPGVGAAVLDDALRPVGEGVTGELYLSGDGLAYGYVNSPGLTAKRFVADPAGLPGARMYRTGDRVRRSADGRLEYLGRTDRQVKLQGQRVELGEVEAVLRGHPGVGSAAVAVRRTPGAGPQLVAFYTPAGPASAPSGEQLRDHAAAHLPAAMTPAVAVRLDRLPRTTSGKVDYRALADAVPGSAGPSGHDAGAAGDTATAPDSGLEVAVRGTWADVLGVEAVHPTDDFFALGGHSLQALRLATRVKRQLGVTVTTRTVYKHPRLRDYTREVAKLTEGAVPTQS